MLRLLITLTVISSASTISAKEITLQQLLSKALENNFQVRIQHKNYEQAHIDEKLAFRDFVFPKAKLQFDVVEEDFYNGPFTDAELKYNDRPLSTGTMRLQFDLFNGFKDYYNHEIGKNERRKQHLKLSLEKKSLVYSIKELYFDLSQKINRSKVLQEDLKRNEELVAATQAKYRQGIIPKSELDRSKIFLIEAQKDLNRQQNEVEKVLIEIQKVSGLDKLVTIKPLPLDQLDSETKNFIAEASSKGSSVKAGDYFNKFLKIAERYHIVKQDLLLSDLGKKRDLADFWPKLQLEGNYGISYKSNRSEYDQDFIGVKLSLIIPLFDSLDTYYLNSKNNLEIAKNKIAKRKQEFEVFRQFENLFIELLTKYKDYQYLKDQYYLRHGIFNTTFKRYKRGAISLRFVLDDKIDLIKNGLELADANAEIQKLKLDIDNLAGDIDIREIP